MKNALEIGDQMTWKYFKELKRSDTKMVVLMKKYRVVSLNGGTQQPWVFLLKEMIILGSFGGTTI